MNRRLFLTGTASALVLPWVPERVYSFPTPRLVPEFYYINGTLISMQHCTLGAGDSIRIHYAGHVFESTFGLVRVPVETQKARLR